MENFFNDNQPTPEEMGQYAQGLEQQNEQITNQNINLQRAVSSGFFSQTENSNLIEYQLNTAEILEKIEHYLKGDLIKRDEHGNEYYEEQTDKDLILVNQYGVTFIMNTLSFYLDKNMILSAYREDRVNEILADLGDELADYIYCNLEKIGMDTKFKRSRFKILVINILHEVESVYRRALGGEEREGLRTGRIVTQNQPIGMGMYGSMGSRGVMKKSFNLFKPSTW